MRLNVSLGRPALVAVSFLILLALCSVTLYAQTDNSNSSTTTPPATGSQQSGSQASSEPQPYSPDEFPLWQRDLRRGEVVTIGVFPFALVYTGLMYDLGRYLILAASKSPSASTYAPWFFAPADKPPYTDGEKLGIVLGSVGVAVVVGIIDYAINASRRRAEEEKRAARAAAEKALAQEK